MKRWFDIAGIVLVGVLVGVGIWMTAGEVRSRTGMTASPQEVQKGEEGGEEGESAARSENAPCQTAENAGDRQGALQEDVYRGNGKESVPEEGWWRGLKVVEDVLATNTLTGTVEERWRTEDGKWHVNIRGLPRLFKNPCNQAIALLLGGGGGGSMPPLPIGPMLDDAFEAALEEPIEISEEDSPEVRTLKEVVREAREEMRRLVEEGMSQSEVLMEHEAEMRKQETTRRDALAKIAEIEEEEGFEAAREYAEAVNGVLAKMGVEEVPVPLSEEEKILERERRRSERRNRR